MTHHHSYPKNPGLEPGTGIPSNGKEFVKMLINAKTAAEEIALQPLDWKPVLFDWQFESVKACFEGDRAETFDAWAKENYEIVPTHYPQRSGKTWLGSQYAEHQRERLQRGNGMAEVSKVPSIRGLGYRTDQAWIDEPHYTTEDKPRPTYGGFLQESDAALESWLQRRSICHRASSCGLA